MKYSPPKSGIAMLVTFALAVSFALTTAAQPSEVVKAEAVFAEAKTLAATAGSETKAIEKFEEAATLFRAAGSAKKVNEVELEHGRFLKSLATREMNGNKPLDAIDYFQKAQTKFRAVGDHLEMAYVFHSIGYISAQQSLNKDAVYFYEKARVEYRIAGDRGGEAAVARNMGLIRSTEKKFNEAAELFTASLKLRNALNQLPEQAVLQLDLGDLRRDNGQKLAALTHYKLGLGHYRKARDLKGEGTAFSRIGDLYSRQFKYADALKNYRAALKIFEGTKDYGSEALAVQAIGGQHLAFGKYADAEQSLRYAADVYMILGDKNSEATAVLDLAVAYKLLNRTAEARFAIERATKSFRDAKNVVGEAYALLVDADFLSFLNQHDEALKNIRAAQKIFDENDGEWAGNYRIARALATHYYFLSNYGEAIKYGRSALADAEKDKDDPRIAGTLVDIANAYSALRQNQKAIELTKRALSIAIKTGSRYSESIALSNIGYDLYLLGKLTDAEQYFKRAIAIMRADGYEREEGYAVHNLGLVYFKQRRFPLALANYDRALALYAKAGDRRPETFLFDSFGELYRELGQPEKSAEYLQKAVVQAREIKYSDVEARALANMMTLWTRRGQARLAILYGKQAVNVYQSIRAGITTAEKADQKSFVRSHEDTYRSLANLLIDEGRLAEAQQVLDLLKEEEFMEFVRRDASEAVDQAKLALTDTEKKALDEYTRLSAQLTALGSRYQALQDAKSKAGGKLPPAEEAEFASLKTNIEEAGVGVRAFLSKLADEFSKKVEDQAVITPASIESLRADLRRAGNDVVLVSTYLLPERYRAIVTTGRTMVDRKVEYKDRKLTAADINRKIAEFQRALQNPRVDPRPLGKELYDIFVKPLEADLEGAKGKTILWSLDGTLRYVPMAALSPDGKTYLAEKYQNVIVTLARTSNLFSKPATEEWRAIGAGVSKPHEGFAALPSVINELNSIVKENGPGGVLEGTKLVDEKFDLNNLRNTLPQQTADGKTFNVVHLATHFKLGANDQDSALLLGDGSRLSLFAISKDEDLDFKDLELLALSACETGVAAGDGSGREVESLGMLAQKKGAKAVLATLWKVADEGTSMFMSEFYRLKKANPQMSKAEAIRLAQKEMIDGKIKSTGRSGGCRADNFATPGKLNDFKCDPNAPFSHPYFWSPFILIGNWR
jgi:CHAT domain-containing protein